LADDHIDLAPDAPSSTLLARRTASAQRCPDSSLAPKDPSSGPIAAPAHEPGGQRQRHYLAHAWLGPASPAAHRLAGVDLNGRHVRGHPILWPTKAVPVHLRRGAAHERAPDHLTTRRPLTVEYARLHVSGGHRLWRSVAGGRRHRCFRTRPSERRSWSQRPALERAHPMKLPVVPPSTKSGRLCDYPIVTDTYSTRGPPFDRSQTAVIPTEESRPSENWRCREHPGPNEGSRPRENSRMSVNWTLSGNWRYCESSIPSENWRRREYPRPHEGGHLHHVRDGRETSAHLPGPDARRSNDRCPGPYTPAYRCSSPASSTAQKTRATAMARVSQQLSRRRPTLPGGYPPSTIGAGGLNFRVRDGNGCGPTAMVTGNLCSIFKRPSRATFP
jgi:hypothetical protein